MIDFEEYITATEEQKPYCPSCKQYGDTLTEYIDAASANDMGVDDYIRSEEGTYNRENGHFLCTPCYVQCGMPSGPRGWVCP